MARRATPAPRHAHAKFSNAMRWTAVALDELASGARAAADVLQSSLAEKTDRAASVTVAPKVGSFNVSA